MIKTVNYKGKQYTFNIQWLGSSYGIRCVESESGFKSIPKEDLNDISKIKQYFLLAIENNHDLKTIELWDGNL